MVRFNSMILMVIVMEYVCLGFSLEEQGITFRNEDDFNDQAERVTGTGCNTPKGAKGECISILKCPALLALIIKPNQQEFLRQSRCGWDRDCPLVCCSNESSMNSKRNCTGSDMRRCKSDESDDCCIPEVTYNIDKFSATNTTQRISSRHCDMSSVPPEQSSECCGRQNSNPKNISAEVTLIDQYPWTAIIEYAGKDTVQVKCGGALISARYVLTAAHCLFIPDWTPVQIRLGDYDIDHLGMDCVKDEGGDEDCTDIAVTILIGDTVSHSDYRFHSRSQTDDIALIRLKDKAPYTDFIRPICLPSATRDFMETAESITTLYVAGWGVKRSVDTHSQLKRHVKLTFVSEEHCYMNYRPLNVILGEGQICAGGENGEDSCKGDSGGALMLVNNQGIEIVGITSFLSCGRANRPAVFTKVFNYLPWIRSIIN